MCRTAGTTLVELLTTLTIVAVLATVAVPNLHTFQLNSRRAAVVNGFLHSLFLARSEAIKRGQSRQRLPLQRRQELRVSTPETGAAAGSCSRIAIATIRLSATAART